MFSLIFKVTHRLYFPLKYTHAHMHTLVPDETRAHAERKQIFFSATSKRLVVSKDTHIHIHTHMHTHTVVYTQSQSGIE